MNSFYKTVTIAALITTGTCSYAALRANDGSFGIANQTSYSISFKLNQVCSTDIGNLSSYTIKSIASNKIMNACNDNVSCIVMAYDNENCTGNEFGGVKVNFINHQMEVFSINDKVSVTGVIGINDYNLFFVEAVEAQTKA